MSAASVSSERMQIQWKALDTICVAEQGQSSTINILNQIHLRSTIHTDRIRPRYPCPGAPLHDNLANVPLNSFLPLAHSIPSSSCPQPRAPLTPFSAAAPYATRQMHCRSISILFTPNLLSPKSAPTPLQRSERDGGAGIQIVGKIRVRIR